MARLPFRADGAVRARPVMRERGCRLDFVHRHTVYIFRFIPAATNMALPRCTTSTHRELDLPFAKTAIDSRGPLTCAHWAHELRG